VATRAVACRSTNIVLSFRNQWQSSVHTRYNKTGGEFSWKS
jgi:hypothetical protein